MRDLPAPDANVSRSLGQPLYPFHFGQRLEPSKRRDPLSHAPEGGGRAGVEG